eukprot:TRINITY_DN1123_c0_g2_i1.p1 TRINITY_DN1123_c0_g2~~TRINITY_DN1123_c0_g2_i1.p1  ORF type:complete len:314 (+),score=79.52 TRINITY_DN1123_c0_g2_i1:40-981(+)
MNILFRIHNHTTRFVSSHTLSSLNKAQPFNCLNSTSKVLFPSYFSLRFISTQTSNNSHKMRVIPVPVLNDNYSYLVIDESTNEAAAVDPVEPQKILGEAEKQGVKITTVLTTHHHHDHADGNPEMASTIKGIPIYGGDDRIPAMTHKVGEGDQIKVGSLSVKVFFTPFHTTGHVLYFVENEKSTDQLALFTGDTLFIGGIGKFFEGSPEQALHAVKVISALPKHTLVYCGHEYTKKNFEFALTIEPENEKLKKKYEWVVNQGKEGLFTVPSTVAEELECNPFMRVAEQSVQKAVGLHDEEEVMRELRAKKEKF